MKTLQASRDADSPYAWARLWVALALVTIGGAGMYSMAWCCRRFRWSSGLRGPMPRFPSRSP